MTSATTAAALLLGLAGAVALRLGIGEDAGVRDPWAGTVFAAVLAVLAVVAVPGVLRGPGEWGPRARSVAAGLGGAAALCVVPLVVHLRTPGGALDPAHLPLWASVVTAVAIAEEVFLRGALWDALDTRPGRDVVALVVTTLAFGLLHVPFYGLEALPLDLAAGLLLGGLRMLTHHWTAPAVAHTVADLAGWWLR